MARATQTDLAVLAALSVAPMTGYALRDAIISDLGAFWAESFGQIYPALDRLTAQGYVSTHPGPRRGSQLYQLTPSGEAHLLTLMQAAPTNTPPATACCCDSSSARPSARRPAGSSFTKLANAPTTNSPASPQSAPQMPASPPLPTLPTGRSPFPLGNTELGPRSPGQTRHWPSWTTWQRLPPTQMGTLAMPELDSAGRKALMGPSPRSCQKNGAKALTRPGRGEQSSGAPVAASKKGGTAGLSLVPSSELTRRNHR